MAVDGEVRLDGRTDRECTGVLSRGTSETEAQLMVAQERFDQACGGDEVAALVEHSRAPVPGELGEPAHVRTDHRESARHGLQSREAEALFERAHHEDIAL